MAQFVIWSRVECRGTGSFVAIASAIPCNSEERGAPEERSLECPNRESAETAAARLARALSDDIHARGARDSNAALERQSSTEPY